MGALQIKMNPGKIMYSVCKEGYLTLLWLYSSLPDDPQVEWNTKLVGRIIADHIKINRIEVVSISFTDMTCHICWHHPQVLLILPHADKPYASQHTILCNRGKKPKLVRCKIRIMCSRLVFFLSRVSGEMRGKVQSKPALHLKQFWYHMQLRHWILLLCQNRCLLR